MLKERARIIIEEEVKAMSLAHAEATERLDLMLRNGAPESELDSARKDQHEAAVTLRRANARYTLILDGVAPADLRDSEETEGSHRRQNAAARKGSLPGECAAYQESARPQERHRGMPMASEAISISTKCS